MLVTYQGIIHSDADGSWIEFPDIPGCFSHAKDIPELLKSAKEALECAVLGMLENGEQLSVAKSALKKYRIKEEFDAMLNIGYQQSLRGEGVPVEEAFAKLEKKYGLRCGAV